ncbi:MAG TPA: geranylgeranylglycerol-phosphate geranylgeranyltransferase [Bacteroidia bacterium]|nr:geranylgeranylglycerol-phosphate geranylgeranyltransferase [Bacteroidia bacterium]
MNFLKLIRLPNLVIIALTQYLIRHTIIIPILAAYNLTSTVSEINFFLLVLSTVLIAAGGYVINDYYDLQIDLINKPSKVVIGKLVPKKQSMNFYVVLTLTGIAIGIYLSFFQNIFLLWQINILSVALLLLYSSVFKKVFLIGNIVISILSALSVYLLLIIEKNIWINFLLNHPDSINAIPYLISAYSLFAFIITWIREIVKDLEDKEGDQVFNRKTLPIISGNSVAKLFIAFLIMTVLFSLMLIQYRQQQWNDWISFAYVVAAIELPLIVLSFITLRANKKKDYTVSSLLTKGIMLTGVLSMLVFYLRYK